MRWLVPVFLIVTTGTTLFAEDAIDTAEAAYFKALAQANAEHDAKLKAAKEQYVTALKDLVKNAAAKGDMKLAQKALDKSRAIEAEVSDPTIKIARQEEKKTTAPQPVELKEEKESKPAQPGYEPGLILTQYPRLPAQDGVGGAYVPPEKLGEPKGSEIINTIAEWKNASEDRNGSVDGYILIEKPGTYAFKCWTWHMMVSMWVNGKQVARYGVGQDQGVVTSIQLPAGYMPVKIVGYAAGQNWFKVLWRPEGEKELVPIPEKLLFHMTKKDEKEP